MKTFELTDSDGNTYAIMRKEEGKPWLYIQFLGALKVDEIKRFLSSNLKAFYELRSPYILSDRRESTGNLFELGYFIENKWAASAVEAGIKCIANVTSKDSASHFTSKDLESRLLGFEFRSFDSIEEAKEWLLQKAAQAQH